MAAVTGAANRVNAAIYTLDPRGVVGTTNLEQNVDIGELRTHIGKTQSSLRVLADSTGGFAVINDNRYDGALARIDAETSDYYILGYSPSNADPKHRNRQVEVKTTRPGVQVASRGWYRTRRPRARAAPALSAVAAAIRRVRLAAPRPAARPRPRRGRACRGRPLAVGWRPWLAAAGIGEAQVPGRRGPAFAERPRARSTASSTEDANAAFASARSRRPRRSPSPIGARR